VDIDKLRDTLARRAEKGRAAIAAVDQKLANEGFVQRAAAEIVEGERSRRAELALELELLERNLAGL
jgi:valyl-tRNA synthetase